MKPKLSVLLVFLSLVSVVIVLYFSYRHFAKLSAGDSNLTQPAEYLGDNACKVCHTMEYTLWQQSHHFKAMMPANDTTVLGNFNGVTVTLDGITSKFYRKGKKFIINTEGADGKLHDYEVLYTFGFKPLQQYLVAFPGGRMQVPRVSWDVNKKQWFNQYAGTKIHHRDWLHWSRGSQNWNTMCAACHSTNLQKNYIAETDSFSTSFDVINVSCESCHGAGSNHVSFIESSTYKKDTSAYTSYLRTLNGANINQINTCTPCHARKSDISAQIINSSELLDNIIPEIPTNEFFHADGQIKEEDYIYTSFLQSKMFQRNVKCSNCHEPHSGKTLFIGNQLCLQCHQTKYNSELHSHHPAKNETITCMSCHMPGKYYMGNDLRHDHSFRVPRPDLSEKYGTPNACKSCHSEKPDSWAATAINKWFGSERKNHFSDDLIPGSMGDKESLKHLANLLADTSVPNIIKATTAFYLGSLPGNESLQLLINCLQSSDAQTRYRALRSLAAFPYTDWQNAALPALSDKVRAVRIAAADLFMQVPANERVPYKVDYDIANQELYQYVLYQADFAVGNVMIGDYYMKMEQGYYAEKYYLRALAADSLINYVRLNLSAYYNQTGKNEEALKMLQELITIDPLNIRGYYNMALLFFEMKDPTKAEVCFRKSDELGNQDPRFFYNYGIFMMNIGKNDRAELIFKKGLSFSPTYPDLIYTLAYLYIQNKQVEKAVPYVRMLKETDPQNPNYQAIFRSINF